MSVRDSKRYKRLRRYARCLLRGIWIRSPEPSAGCFYERIGVPFEADPARIDFVLSELELDAFSENEKARLNEARAVLGHDTKRELYRLQQRTLRKLGVVPVPLRRRRLRGPIAAVLRVLDFFVFGRRSG